MPTYIYFVFRKVKLFWKIYKWEYKGCYSKKQLLHYIETLYSDSLKIVSVPYSLKNYYLDKFKKARKNESL